MKIKGQEGEYFYPALFQEYAKTAWTLTTQVFSSMEEAEKFFNPIQAITAFRWPVEEISTGIYYVPSENELKEME
jgi:hypothetical protein